MSLIILSVVLTFTILFSLSVPLGQRRSQRDAGARTRDGRGPGSRPAPIAFVLPRPGPENDSKTSRRGGANAKEKRYSERASYTSGTFATPVMPD